MPESRSFGWALIAVLSAASAACSDSSPVAGTGAAWRAHSEPSGIEFKRPQSWTVRTDAATGRIDFDIPGGGRVLVWPAFSPAPEVNDQTIVRHLANRVWPRARWLTNPTGGAHAVLRGEQDGRRLAALLASSRSANGTALVLYGIEAAPDRFDAVARDGLEVFATLRARGNEPPGSDTSALTYTKWRDPREGAFTVDVPVGWTAEGGAFRHAAVDVRSQLIVRSPDGAIVVRSGDDALSTFVEPLPFFPEGSLYSAGYGVQMRVRRLISAQQFVADYVRSSAGRSCANLTVTERRDRAEAVRRVNDIYQAHGLAARIRAAEITFSCTLGNRAMRGYYFVALQIIQTDGPAVWRAEHVLGFLADANRSAEAESVLARVAASTAIDPEWMARQQQTTAATVAIVRDTSAVISETIADTYWSRQRVDSEISRRRSNAILGVEDAVDEVTGRRFKVEAGSTHYWINPKGTIVGTDVDAVPRGDFRALTVR